MLGNAHGVEDRGRPGLAVQQGGLSQVRSRDSRDLGHMPGRIFFNGLFQDCKTLGPFSDIIGGMEVLFEDNVNQAVDPRDIGARPLSEPDMRIVNKIYPAGIHHDQVRPFSENRLPDVVREYRVIVRGIASRHQDGF
ncbi:MAG: hypothetical protein ACD_75C02342G0002 [uncultured bacterium]|nr:MAG: hypothetical protein ACD_75C02342G0002 [uncultured bacterium]